MMAITFKRIGKFFLFLLSIFLIIFLLIALMSLLGPDKVRNIEHVINSTWQTTSFVRWCVLLITIFFMPRFILSKAKKYNSDKQKLHHDYLMAEAQGAQYETLQELAAAHDNASKFANLYETMYQRRWYISLSFVLFEIIFVQIPHYI